MCVRACMLGTDKQMKIGGSGMNCSKRTIGHAAAAASAKPATTSTSQEAAVASATTASS